jgi:hypothetical protein
MLVFGIGVNPKGVGGRDPKILVMEGVVSGLLRSKGEDGNPGPPSLQTRLMVFGRGFVITGLV